MKSKMKRFLGILLSLTLVLGMMPGMSLTAYADGTVSYVYYTVDGTIATKHTDGRCTSYTTLTNTINEWSSGWYVVPADGVTIADRITVTGEVNLILTDGATLTASKGITVTGENTLNIYAQSEGTGALTATGLSSQAGIGGKSMSANNANACGTVNIHGGTVNVTGIAAGIGGGYNGNGGTVTIYGGDVTATGGYGSSGIGFAGTGTDGCRSHHGYRHGEPDPLRRQDPDRKQGHHGG